MKRFRAGLAMAAAAALLWGCGGAEEEGAKGPEILDFRTSAITAEYWTYVTLSWETRNATKVTLSSRGKEIEIEAGVSTAEVFLEEGSNEFMLVAEGDGEPAVAQTMVRGIAVQPTIHSFTATPEAVEAGEEVLLSWDTEGADMMAIASNNAPALDFGENPESSGSVAVHPTETTIYYLMIHRRMESAEMQVVVEVRDAP